MVAREINADLILPELYRGVLEEESWGRALDLVGESFRGSALFLGSVAANGSYGMLVRGVDKQCGTLLSGPLATPDANPFIGPMMRKPACSAQLTATMCGDQALVSSRVYDEALRPYGQRHVVGAKLEARGRTVRSIALTRPSCEGDFTEDEALQLDLLLPHISRAVQLREDLAQLRCQSSAAFAALDRVERGILILDENRSILFANIEAQRIFGLDDGLRSHGAGLVVDHHQAAENLRDVLRCLDADRSTIATQTFQRICVPRKTGGLPFILTFTLAPELMIRSEGIGAAPVVATIVDPERNLSPSTSLLRQIYALTHAEAELAAALCAADLKQAAASLGISINTAKTHLKVIFQKVGVSRQSALVRLISLHAIN